MENKYLPVLLQLAQDAGDIALRYRDDSAPTYKADQSVVTKADKEISQLAHARLKEFLAQPGHLLIDEETPGMERYLNTESLNAHEFIFAIDPIDGTRAYANRMPGFGISIGLLKNLKPWLGVVYFPALRELFYAENGRAFFVQNAFTMEQVTTEIKPIHQEINKQAIFLLPDSYFNRFDWDFTNLHIMIPACAVVDLCYPAIGRGCGSLIRSYLWDFVGSWPIVRAAGLELYNLNDGQALDQIRRDIFTERTTPWKLRDFYVVCAASNFKKLQSKITLKGRTSG